MTEYKKGNVRDALTTLFWRLKESPNPLCAEWLYEYDNIRGHDDILTTYRDKIMDKTLESLEKNVADTKAVADAAEAAYDIYEEASAVADEAYAVASHALLEYLKEHGDEQI